MKFYVEIKKTKDGAGRYASIKCDLGYTQKIVNINRQDIAEIMGISVTDLMTKPIGKYNLEGKEINDERT